MTTGRGPFRKVMSTGGSLVVTIPSQIAQMSDIDEGDMVEFEYLGKGQLRLTKAELTPREEVESKKKEE